MTSALLTRKTHRQKRSLLPLFDDVTLATGRVHEICGPARRTFAAIIASRMKGRVFWIRPGWHPDQLYLPGLARIFNPGRLTILNPHRVEEFLWTMEMTLRDGTIPLVVGDFHTTVELTPVRRLHLAAETAFENHQKIVTGLLLSPAQGGSPGVETRWHMRGDHAGEETAWRLERRRARMEPPKAWQMCPDWTVTPAPYTGP